MKINDVEYIELEKHLSELKEIQDKLKSLEEKKTSKKNVKRFGESETLKLIKALTQLFQIEEESINEDYLVETNITIIDPANVCCVTGKSEQAKRILSMFKCSKVEDKPEPKLDYVMEKGEIPKSRYSQEYLLKIMNILKITSDSIDITTRHDYPITLENKDFKFILAPRIEE